MLDITSFIDEIVVKKGEEFLNFNKRTQSIAMFYIFESRDVRDAVFDAIKKSRIDEIDVHKFMNKGLDVESAQNNMKQAGVEEYILVDGSEAHMKIDGEKAEKSIVVAMIFKSIPHKKIFMNIFKLAKKYGVVQ